MCASCVASTPKRKIAKHQPVALETGAGAAAAAGAAVPARHGAAGRTGLHLCTDSSTAGLQTLLLHWKQVLSQRQLLERLFQHDMGLPEARLRRAVSYGGNPERLHRALHKLIRGDAITVATVGGSVTGACSGLAGENPMTMACK